MERRYSMDFFLGDSNGEEDWTVSGFYVENEDTIYGGRELYYNGNKITYYFFPIDHDEALMFLYIGHDTFDEFIDNIDDYNLEGANKAWPLLIRALHNGANDNYSGSALIKLPDLTHSNKMFWCLATKVENIDLKDLETLYIIKKLGNLVSDAMDMLTQINENDISTWDSIKGNARAGYDSYQRGRKAMKIASFALAIGGALLGFDTSGFVGD